METQHGGKIILGVCDAIVHRSSNSVLLVPKKKSSGSYQGDIYIVINNYIQHGEQ
jgi:hypothetical protein